MTPFLLYQQSGPVVTLTMDRPDERNSLTGNTAIAEFLAVVDRIESDEGVRCVILTGNGPSFCAGGNVQAMQRLTTSAVDQMAVMREYRVGIQRMALRFYGLDVPVIAAINGHAIGAGLDLACMCDIRIASDRAKFAESFVKLGIIPGDGGAWLLPRAIGPARAAELAFTAETIDAQTALAWGLVSRVVDGETLLAEARSLADRIAANPAHSLRLTKRLMREAVTAPFGSILELSAAYQAIAHKTKAHSEALSAFAERRKPAG
jgi:enoyl-CoA hydratase/carnithine racemase